MKFSTIFSVGALFAVSSNALPAPAPAPTGAPALKPRQGFGWAPPIGGPQEPGTLTPAVAQATGAPVLKPRQGFGWAPPIGGPEEPGTMSPDLAARAARAVATAAPETPRRHLREKRAIQFPGSEGGEVLTAAQRCDLGELSYCATAEDAPEKRAAQEDGWGGWAPFISWDRSFLEQPAGDDSDDESDDSTTIDFDDSKRSVEKRFEWSPEIELETEDQECGADGCEKRSTDKRQLDGFEWTPEIQFEGEFEECGPDECGEKRSVDKRQLDFTWDPEIEIETEDQECSVDGC